MAGPALPRCSASSWSWGPSRSTTTACAATGRENNNNNLCLVSHNENVFPTLAFLGPPEACPSRETRSSEPRHGSASLWGHGDMIRPERCNCRRPMCRSGILFHHLSYGVGVSAQDGAAALLQSLRVAEGDQPPVRGAACGRRLLVLRWRGGPGGQVGQRVILMSAQITHLIHSHAAM
jgi:hypothetical protein